MAITKTLTLSELFLAEGKRQRQKKGHVIQTTDSRQNFNFITSGYIKRYLITSDGSIAVEAIYGPNDVFSLTLIYKALFNQALYDGLETYYFETMTDCEINTINIDVLQHYIKTNPFLYQDLLSQTGKRLHAAIQGLENITIKSAYNRIAHLLLYLGRRFGNKKPGGIEIDVPLTHQDLASILSLTRETVSVNLTALRKKKLISGNKYIQIVDMEKLEEEAYY